MVGLTAGAGAGPSEALRHGGGDVHGDHYPRGTPQLAPGPLCGSTHDA